MSKVWHVRLVQGLLFWGGIALIVWQTNWLVGLGLFLAMWGNNITK